MFKVNGYSQPSTIKYRNPSSGAETVINHIKTTSEVTLYHAGTARFTSKSDNVSNSSTYTSYISRGDYSYSLGYRSADPGSSLTTTDLFIGDTLTFYANPPSSSYKVTNVQLSINGHNYSTSSSALSLGLTESNMNFYKSQSITASVTCTQALANVTGLSITGSTLSWNAQPGSTFHYGIRGPSSYSHCFSSAPHVSGTTTGTSVAISSPPPSGTYYYQVSIYSSRSGYANSSTVSAVLSQAAAVVQKMSTPTGLKATGRTISWNKVTNASNGYRIEIQQLVGASCMPYYTTYGTYTVSQPSGNPSYVSLVGGRARVQTIAVSGYTQSDWTNYVSFT